MIPYDIAVINTTAVQLATQPRRVFW